MTAKNSAPAKTAPASKSAPKAAKTTAKAAEVEDKKKHENFVGRMVTKGYTEKQVRLLSEWYLRVRKSA